MNKITSSSGVEHAVEFVKRSGGWVSPGEATVVSVCGKTITGHTGATIPSGIDCGSCRRVLRTRGWQL